MPTTADIQFAPNQQSGSDALGGASPVAYNIVVEPTGAIRRRPCITQGAHEGHDEGHAPTASLDPGGIIGVHPMADHLFVVGATGSGVRLARPVFAVTGGGSTQVASLPGTLRSTAAETEMLAVFAGGAEIVKVENATLAGSDLGGSPPLSSHVIANASRLLSNDVAVDRTKVRFSDTAIGLVTYAGHEVWTVGVGTAGFFTAEARPDRILAIHENTTEVFVFGALTLEIWTPDATTVYARTAVFEYGCGARHSIVKVDSSFAWLDERRRFVLSEGRSSDTQADRSGGAGGRIISGPIQRTLDGIETVDDCFGYRIHEGQVDLLVWTFPTDGRTFVYQMGGGWSQWAGWSGNWSRFLVNAAAHDTNSSSNIVGLTDGRVGELSFDAQTDLGEPVRCYVEAGFDAHGTELPKVCERVMLTLRRGETESTTAPQAWLKWRDSPGAAWRQVPVSLGATGKREIVREFFSLGGVFRRRQWAFEFSGDTELVLVAAKVSFTVLED